MISSAMTKIPNNKRIATCDLIEQLFLSLIKKNVAEIKDMPIAAYKYRNLSMIINLQHKLMFFIIVMYKVSFGKLPDIFYAICVVAWFISNSNIETIGRMKDYRLQLCTT
jgi:hypothetical protein